MKPIKTFENIIKDFLKNRELKELIDILKNYNDNFRFVGGCIRNALLKKEVKDYDFATSFSPDEVINILKKNNLSYYTTGISHGTVTAIINKSTFEITTLRLDEACNGRHAKVQYTTSWEADSNRRDFTINALYMDFNGYIYDYHSGLKDIEQRKIKFIGNAEERIKEDYLRILRLFRFWSYYGQDKLDDLTLEACKKLASNLNKLSKERIKEEFSKILVSPKALETLNLMKEYNILNSFNLQFSDNFSELEYLINEEISYNLSFSFIRRLYFIINNDNDFIEKTVDAFKLSKKETIYLKTLFEISHKNFNEVIYYFGKEYACDYYILHKIKDLSIYTKLLDKDIKLPIKADDLINNGFKPGKELGLKLKTLEGIWINSEFSLSKNELLNKII